MNFLLLFAVRFDLHPTIIQLLFAIILLLVSDVQAYLVDCYDSIMPVTTRSKSLLLTKSTTGSSKESSLLTSSST
jgi:hypothetical protein